MTLPYAWRNFTPLPNQGLISMKFRYKFTKRGDVVERPRTKFWCEAISSVDAWQFFFISGDPWPYVKSLSFSKDTVLEPVLFRHSLWRVFWRCFGWIIYTHSLHDVNQTWTVLMDRMTSLTAVKKIGFGTGRKPSKYGYRGKDRWRDRRIATRRIER